MNRTRLELIIKRCGWQGAWDDQIDGLATKLADLSQRGSYRKLLSNLEVANDRSNFSASVLEATMAYQFESAGMNLQYEVRQSLDDDSSIDFHCNADPGDEIYIEVRLLQQDKDTSDAIEDQLTHSHRWAVFKTGEDEARDVIRVQNVVLDKVQRDDGKPRKFSSLVPGKLNLVAVDVSRMILGAFDFYDCLLVGLGDRAVDPVHQRGIFGLFQHWREGDSAQFKALAQSYSHIREALYGILFLFRHPQDELFNYSLEHILVCNPSLVDRDAVGRIVEKIRKAVPLHRR